MSEPQTDIVLLILRTARRHGVTFRLEPRPAQEPILHATPKVSVTAALRQAITRCKPALVTLLETEAVGYCTAADGTVWRQDLRRCETCGAHDWGIYGEEETKHGLVNVWGCLTCKADVQDLDKELDEMLLAQRWQTGDASREAS